MTLLKFPKQIAWRSNGYKDFIRSKPCLICGRQEQVIAHHEGLYRNAWGSKPPDSHCVPLCVWCHQRRHNGAISSFYGNIDVKQTIIDLLTEYLSERK